MRSNKKMLAVSAILAAAMMMTACGGNTASSSTASSTASSVASSAASSEAVSESQAEDGVVKPIDTGSAEDITSDKESYKTAADIKSIKDGQIDLVLYSYDAYEQADIDGLKEGDVIRTHLDGADEATDVTIESIETNSDTGYVTINGGIEEGGIDLCMDHDVYRTLTFDDYPVYYKTGEVTMPLADDVTLSDSSADPQATAVESDGAAAVEEAFNADPDYWICNNTTIFTDHGKVSSILRVWVP